MGNNSNRFTLGGLGVVLFVVFLTLKLCNVINWAWVWVFAPLWMPIVLFFGIYLLIFLVAAIAALIACLFDKKKK